MGGRLTTHVLDVATGKPAAGMEIELWRVGENGVRQWLCSAVTDGDGRVKEPLLQGDSMSEGVYELMFKVGAYYRAKNTEKSNQGMFFLEDVPIRFLVAERNEHYHVPLLIAPGGYSTYRGS